MILLLNSREIRCKIGVKFDLQIYAQNGYFKQIRQNGYFMDKTDIKIWIFWAKVGQ